MCRAPASVLYNVDSIVSIKASLIHVPASPPLSVCISPINSNFAHLPICTARHIRLPSRLTLARPGDGEGNTQHFVANVLLEAQEMNRHQQYVTLVECGDYIYSSLYHSANQKIGIMPCDQSEARV